MDAPSRHRLRDTALPLSVALVVAALVALGLSSVSSGASGPSEVTSALNEGQCVQGVPPAKCHPGGPLAGPNNHPKTVPLPAPFWPSPAMVHCGATFLSESAQSQLSNRFGSISCFRFENHNQWVVIGDGMATFGDGSTPGGAMVAVATCTEAGESTCLDPNATHDFGDFTVSYPPDPTTWPVALQTTFGGRLLYVEDGSCGLFTFDLSDHQWYGRSPAVINSLLEGKGASTVATPPPQRGSTALIQRPPAPTGPCGQ